MIKVTWGSATTTNCSERNFTKTSYLLKYIWSSLVIDNIYLIVSPVGSSEKCIFIKFALEQSDINRINDWR